MSQTEAWTIGRLLQWTADYLKQHGSDSPRLDAEVLLAFARGCQRIQLYTDFGEPAGDELRGRFRELVRRRAEGTPVAYLVGRREFYSLSFRVSPDVLIPRPETEFLVISLLDAIKERIESHGPPSPSPESPSPDPPAVRVADVGTGSGVIAICAARLGGCRVTALDISAAALEIARANAAELGAADRIEFLQSDLFAAVPADQWFDFVASNPPYISAAEMESLPRDVKDYEPAVALSAGPSGLAVIERLVPQAVERLAPGGSLLMEISPMIEQPVRELIANRSPLALQPTVKDLAGLARVIIAKKTA